MEKMADHSEKKKNPITNKPPIVKKRGSRSRLISADAKNTRKFSNNIGVLDVLPHHDANHQQQQQQQQDCLLVNYMAKARNEQIGHHAWQIHRSSSSSSSSSSKMVVSTNYHTTICSTSSSKNSTVGHDHHHHNKSFKMEPAAAYYPVSVSEPIWSTTSPSTCPSTSTTTSAAPVGGGSAMKKKQEVEMELDDGFDDDEWVDINNDIIASSTYSWWIGFLESLDKKGGKSNNYDTNQIKLINKEEECCSLSLSSWGHDINYNGDEESTKNQKNGDDEQASIQDVLLEGDDQQSSSSSVKPTTDEWLMIPGIDQHSD